MGIKSCCETMFMERSQNVQDEGKMQVSGRKCTSTALGVSSVGLAAVAVLALLGVVSGGGAVAGGCGAAAAVAGFGALAVRHPSKKKPKEDQAEGVKVMAQAAPAARAAATSAATDGTVSG